MSVHAVSGTDNNGVKYELLSNGTAKVVGGDASKIGSKLIIAASVNYDNKSYPVKKIADSAFEYLEGLQTWNFTTVSLPEGLEEIGICAFSECPLSGSLTIPNSVKTIGQGAFMCLTTKSELTGTLKLGTGLKTIGFRAFYGTPFTTVECMATTPPTTKPSAFDSSTYSKATLKVPSNSLSSYKSATDWKDFKSIVGLTVDVAATSISVSPTSVTLTEKETKQLTATVSPSNATNKTVSWSSDKTSVAKVDSNGKVTAVSAGTAIITAKTANGKTATCTVTVKSSVVEVTSITLNKTSLSLERNEYYQLTATVSPSNAADKTVTWSSSNTSIAKVDSKGVVTGVSAGTATITAKTSNGKSATCKVTVKAATIEVLLISLNRTSLSLELNETYQLIATVSPSNATNKTITWSSSNTSIAKVDSNGKVTAVSAGTATITAKTSNGLIARCTVEVKKGYVAAESITVSPSSLKLETGDSKFLSASVSPTDATYKAITWTSSDNSIATVSTSGTVTGVKEGTVKITARNADGVSGTCEVTVIKASTSNHKFEIVIDGNVYNNALLFAGTQIDIQVYYDGIDITKSASFSSSKPSVATVDSNGTINCIKEGDAMITATYKNISGLQFQASLKVEILPISPTVLPATNITNESFTTNWESAKYATAYLLDVELYDEASKSYKPTNFTLYNVGNITSFTIGIKGIITNRLRYRVYYMIDDAASDASQWMVVNLNSGSQNEEAVVFTFSDYGWANGAAINDIPQKNGVKISATKNTGTVVPAYYTAGAAMRLYGGNKFSVSAERTISHIEFTFADPYNFESITHSGASSVQLSAGSYSEDGTSGTWDLNAKSGEITIIGTKGSARIVNVTVYLKDQTPQTVKATGISLNETNKTADIGSSFQLIATVKPDNATNKIVAWKSSNTSVATVDKDGIVVLTGAGSCEITASTTDGSNLTASCKITSKAPAPAEKSTEFIFSEYGYYNAQTDFTIPTKDGIEIRCDKNTGTVKPAYYTLGEAIRLYGSNRFYIQSSKKIIRLEFQFVKDYGFESITHSGSSAIQLSSGTYSESGNIGIWNLNATSGNLTIIGTKGSARITKIIVTYEDGGTSTVKATGLSLNMTSKSANVGESFRLTATVTPSNATNKVVKWSTSNSNVATVDQTGLVSVVGAGKCNISASTTDGSNLNAICAVTANVSGVDEILMDDIEYDVYTLSGKLLLHKADAEAVRMLDKGIYIINGKKYMIR